MQEIRKTLSGAWKLPAQEFLRKRDQRQTRSYSGFVIATRASGLLNTESNFSEIFSHTLRVMRPATMPTAYAPATSTHSRDWVTIGE